jgi:hypothetical protein
MIFLTGFRATDLIRLIFSDQNHLTEADCRRINTGVLRDKWMVCGTTPITVPHQLVVPQGELCTLYCGFFAGRCPAVLINLTKS